VREVLSELDRDFRKLYSTTWRPSIPPEQVVRALLLHVFYGVRSGWQLMEQLDDNLLYRWFVGLSPDDAVWDATTVTKDRERLQHGDMFNRFMEKLLYHKDVTPLLSDEHFSVDGTLIGAWAGHKSFKPTDDKDGDGEHAHGMRRTNATHESTTDPDSRLYRKSEDRESKRCYRGHATRENRSGLAVRGWSRRHAARRNVRHRRRCWRRKHRHMHASRSARTRPMMLTNTLNACGRRTSHRTLPSPRMSRRPDRRARPPSTDEPTRHKGYTLSQGKRKMIECMFGWGNPHGTMRKTKHKGVGRSRRRLSAQSDRRQPHPYPETAGAEGIGASEYTRTP
jgi:transposase